MVANDVFVADDKSDDLLGRLFSPTQEKLARSPVIAFQDEDSLGFSRLDQLQTPSVNQTARVVRSLHSGSMYSAQMLGDKNPVNIIDWSTVVRVPSPLHESEMRKRIDQRHSKALERMKKSN